MKGANLFSMMIFMIIAASCAGAPAAAPRLVAPPSTGAEAPGEEVSFPAGTGRMVKAPPYSADPATLFIDAPKEDTTYPAPPKPLAAYNRYRDRIIYGVAFEASVPLRASFESDRPGTAALKRGDKVEILEARDWTWVGKGYRSGFRVRAAASGAVGWAPAAAIALALAEGDGNWYGLREVAACALFYGNINLYTSELVAGGPLSGGSASDPADSPRYSLGGYTTTTVDAFELADPDGDGRTELRVRIAEEDGTYYSDRIIYSLEIWFAGPPAKKTMVFNSLPRNFYDAYTLDLLSVDVLRLADDKARIKVAYRVDGADATYTTTTYFLKKGAAYSTSITYPFVGKAAFGGPISLNTKADADSPELPGEPSDRFLVVDEGGPGSEWYRAFTPAGAEGWIKKTYLEPLEREPWSFGPYDVESFKRWMKGE